MAHITEISSIGTALCVMQGAIFILFLTNIKFITDIILSEKLTVNNISKFYPFTLKSALLYHSRITMQNLIIKLRDAYGLPISQRNYRFGYFRKWL